jgi:hypothetical protein
LQARSPAELSGRTKFPPSGHGICEKIVDEAICVPKITIVRQSSFKQESEGRQEEA